MIGADAAWRQRPCHRRCGPSSARQRGERIGRTMCIEVFVGLRFESGTTDGAGSSDGIFQVSTIVVQSVQDRFFPTDVN